MIKPNSVSGWWLWILFYLSYAFTVIGDAIGIAVVWPAFKRTRHRAFLFLAAAFVLGIFDTICDHTIGTIEMAPAQWVAYRTLRRFSYYADIILLVAGVVLLTRSYLAIAPKETKPVDKIDI
jgi:hypothetical protein